MIYFYNIYFLEFKNMSVLLGYIFVNFTNVFQTFGISKIFRFLKKFLLLINSISIWSKIQGVPVIYIFKILWLIKCIYLRKTFCVTIYNAFQKFGVSTFFFLSFFKEINTFIQEGCVKSDDAENSALHHRNKLYFKVY